MMNKHEAAAFLGVSERTLWNSVRQGRLPHTYVRGKNGKELRFEKRDLEDFKRALHAPTVAPAVVSSPPPPSILSAPIETTLPALRDAIQTFTVAPARDRPLLVTELAAKHTLKLREAAILSGLSQKALREAIRSEKLKAAKLYGAWRIRPYDLHAFVASLW